MRKFIIISIFITLQTLLSQTFEPTKLKVVYPKTYDSSSQKVYLDEHPDFNVTNKYFLGWHWESGKAMTKALKMNQIMPNVKATNEVNNYYIADSCNVVIRSDIQGNVLINSRAWHYKPNFFMTEVRDTDLTFMSPIDGFLGFGSIYGEKGSNKLIISPNSNIPQDSIILKNQVLSNKYFFDDSKYKSTEVIASDYQYQPLYGSQVIGEELYLSINLNREYVGDLGTSPDTVLSIKVRYVNLPDSLGNIKKRGAVKFTQFSMDTVAFDTLPQNRGFTKKMVNANYDTVFRITKRMLRKGNESDRCVTLNAKMLFNDQYNELNNYFLKGKNGIKDSLLIDSLIIEVKYHKRNSLGINWIRLETKPAKDMYCGYWDSAMVNWVERDITYATYHSSDLAIRGNKPFRFYLRDEYGLEYWPTNRYFYKLFGSVFTSEMIPHYERMYESYFKPKEKWRSLFSYTTCSSTPTYRYGNGGWNKYNINNFENYTLNQKYGFSKTNYETGVDTLNSNYESGILQIQGIPNITIQGLRDTTFSTYEKYLGTFQLSSYESGLYGFYFLHNHNGFLYSKLPWYGQFFVLTDWWRNVVIRSDSINRDTFAVHRDYRPKTGEETRLWIDNILNMGAKGIHTDGEITGDIKNMFEGHDPYFKDVTATKLGFTQRYNDSIMNLNNNNHLNYILDNRAGTDFIPRDDASHLGRYINFDSSAKYLGVSDERIYTGQRSNRLEIYKEFSKIRFIENDLLKLKLVSWYGKGFKVLTNQDTNFQQNIFGNIINFDTSKLFTKRIWNPSTQNIQFQKEAWDSSFFDLTLLRDTSDTQINLNVPITIGIQNRRTDPLIYTPSFVTPLGEQYNLDFYTTAEFDDFVSKDSSKNLYGYMLPKSYWKSQFWKRLACRELHLPFNLPYNPPKYPTVDDRIKYLAIRELGVGTPYFTDTLNYYFTKKEFYHAIDTVIRPNGTLISRLLPGQGKLLKVRRMNALDDICHQPLSCSDIIPLLTFTVEKDINRWDSCYYVLKVTSTSGWQLDTIDIKSIIKSDRTSSFLTFNSNLNFITDPTDSSVTVRIDALTNSQTIELGTFRIDCDEHFTVNYQFGRKIMEIYPYCEDDDSFESDCICGYQMRSSTNCCDNIELYSAATTENGQLSGKYNVNIKQNSTDCAICEVCLVRKNDTKVLAKLSKEKNEKKLQILNFTNIGKINMDKSNGRTKDTINAYIKDKDGKLICKKEVILETFDWKQEKSIEFDNEPTESNTTDLTLQYFPNPVEELLNIEINSDICKKVKVRITNLGSIEIFSKELKTNNLTQISTEEIPNGVYFLKIEDCESDKFIIWKIVIRK